MTGRPPLGRYRVDVNLVLELAARSEEHADELAEGIARLVAERASSTVRNLNGRTHRVIADATTVGSSSAV
jgi:adenylosuccinate lyase